ncbi:MAG: hypothetical protein ABIT70_08230 [Sulfuriferula sp.]
MLESVVTVTVLSDAAPLLAAIESSAADVAAPVTSYVFSVPTVDADNVAVIVAMRAEMF